MHSRAITKGWGGTMTTFKGNQIGRRIALGSVVGLGVAMAFVIIDPDALDALAHLLGWNHHGKLTTTTDSAIPPGAPIGGQFTLTNQFNRTMTPASFHGRWMLVYFGYTRCPDECPLTLEKMAIMMNSLGKLAKHVAPVFITVDPTHDTPAVLRTYLPKFSDTIIGLTGKVPEIAKVAKEYDAYFNTTDHEASGQSLISHSTFIYLMAPNGKFENLFPVSITVPQLVQVMKKAISQ
ncbi:SCO family protein [Acidiphilium acidophilum]|uniref:SCO family protein n=2 Tax=Acidiphilium acidophilum TaxID=76588 RepID=A0AAW9DMV5_ACIAO|nr:SCO family protein [Acidiphilium acidophilum]MDX5929653.1 SCO family protein [Acidiphilium acidophilum]MDX5929662.1 SCO family protein [Acidiphilium acidophilum]GBR73290.1 electron transport transmembrane protein SenC/PrrC [Acidiphilium acidophilum DSM 700]